jgi:Flp pilus assembly protein TadG
MVSIQPDAATPGPQLNGRDGFAQLTLHRYDRKFMSRRGMATVEMAIVLPVLLLLALACADFGRVVHGFVTVANAARCGAEYGSMHKFTAFTESSWQTQVRQAVRDEMEGLAGFEPAELQVKVTTTTDEDDLFRASVEVVYPFRMVVNWPALPAATTLRHTVLMRQIR